MRGIEQVLMNWSNHRHTHPRPSDTLALRTGEIGIYRCGPGGCRNGLLRREGLSIDHTGVGDELELI